MRLSSWTRPRRECSEQYICLKTVSNFCRTFVESFEPINDPAYSPVLTHRSMYSKPGICDSACAFINEESRAGGEKKQR